jgi:hypothetical protein
LELVDVEFRFTGISMSHIRTEMPTIVLLPWGEGGDPPAAGEAGEGSLGCVGPFGPLSPRKSPHRSSLTYLNRLRGKPTIHRGTTER